MKKSLIAAAGASVAAVAMPAVSVFATTTTLTDEVIVNVLDSCIMEPVDIPNNTTPGQDGNDIKVTYGAYDLIRGQLLSDIGNTAGPASGDNTSVEDKGSIKVVCSATGTSGSDNTWTLSVKGENGAAMVGSGTADGQSIATSTETSGTAGAWAFKVVTVSGANANYATYSAIPTAKSTVVTSNGSAEYKMRYRVYAGTATPLGTYTGTVTYTLANPAG